MARHDRPTGSDVKIITLNVNGIRSAARKGFYDWMEAQDADVVCLQETKAQEHQLPLEAATVAHYSGVFFDASRKGYSGVAIDPDVVLVAALGDRSPVRPREKTEARVSRLRSSASAASCAGLRSIWLAGDAQIVWELANGATPNAWAAATGQSPFRAMKLMDSARRRTPMSARDNVRLTMKALEDSLTGKRVPDQALDEVIIRLCSQK